MKKLLLLVVIAIAVSAAAWPSLPERVPMHWNARGEIDGWDSKTTGAVFMPSVMLGLALLFSAIPALSPKGFEVNTHSRAFHWIAFATVALLLIIHIAAILAALHHHVLIDVVVPVAVGVLFVVLGNYMPKFKRNFFIGIRTPWTLTDDEVWLRTHRLGALVFTLAGAVMILAPLLGLQRNPLFIMIVVVLAAMVPIVYSFLIYRQRQSTQF
jgi:uncharacterized membrane protein